jgi:hypothetical protein
MDFLAVVRAETNMGIFLSGIADSQKPGKKSSMNAEGPGFFDRCRARLRTLLAAAALVRARGFYVDGNPVSREKWQNLSETSRAPRCESRNLSRKFGV